MRAVLGGLGKATRYGLTKDTAKRLARAKGVKPRMAKKRSSKDIEG